MLPVAHMIVGDEFARCSLHRSTAEEHHLVHALGLDAEYPAFRERVHGTDCAELDRSRQRLDAVLFQPLRDGAASDSMVELFQLALDPAVIPARVARRHADDQSADRLHNAGTTDAAPRRMRPLGGGSAVGARRGLCRE